MEKFTFTATCNKTNKTITVKCSIPDDGEVAFSELSDQAYEKACDIAQKKFGHEDFELFSED